MKTIRLTLRIFSFLDLISLVFICMQTWVIVKNIDTLPDEKLAIFRAVGIIFMFFTLIVTVIGLFLNRRIGFITYYVQFPFKLLLGVFSIGFITLLPEFFSYYEDDWFDWLFRICTVAEFFRLYFTIYIHRKHNAQLS